MDKILNGKTVAQAVKDNVASWIKTYLKSPPKLAILTFGEDPASKVYVKNKLKAAEEVGIDAYHFTFTEEQCLCTDEFFELLTGIIDASNGVILQLPVPNWCDAQRILDCIPAAKDVDGLTSRQVGRLYVGGNGDTLVPCTPAGIMEILEAHNLERGNGKNALVIGRSHLVGRPIAELLLQDDWTVTIAHSKTPKETLRDLFSRADLVISAAGKMNLLTEDDANQHWKDNRHDPYGCFNFKRNRIIIDVSINRDKDGKLCGDFSEEFKDAYSEYYTPVPGGVGPMTVAMLMWNTYLATADQQRGV